MCLAKILHSRIGWLGDVRGQQGKMSQKKNVAPKVRLEQDTNVSKDSLNINSIPPKHEEEKSQSSLG
jgi:hypothetical protein